MSNKPTAKRRSQREASRRPASLVVNPASSKPKRLPCLVLESSREGFRVRGNAQLRRGETIELVFHEDQATAELCNVVWVGKPGSKQEGEVGLETVQTLSL